MGTELAKLSRIQLLTRNIKAKTQIVTIYKTAALFAWQDSKKSLSNFRKINFNFSKLFKEFISRK